MSSQGNQSSIQDANPANAAMLNTPPTMPVGRHPTAPSAGMDAILENMMKNVPDPSQIVVAPASVHAPSQVIPPPVTPQAAPVEQPKPEVKVDGFTPQVEAPAEPVQPQAVVADDDGEDLNDEILAKKPGFQNLRANYKKVKEEAKALAERLAQAEAEREEYRTGKKVPETLQEQEAELARLRNIGKIHDLKSSPEYLEKLAPLKEIESGIKKLMTDYEVPEEELGVELAHLRSLKSEKQINAFLAERFDPVGAMEVKNLLKQEQAVHAEVRSLEADAEKGLQTLQAQAEATKTQRLNQQRQKVQGWVRESWNQVGQELRADGRFAGLVHQEGRSQWNSEVVQPTLQKAAEASGALIKSIIEEGLTATNVKAIQKMTMLAQHAALTAEQLNQSLDHIRTQENTAIRDTNIFRPQTQGSAPVTAPAKPRERMNPDSFADKSLGLIPGMK